MKKDNEKTKITPKKREQMIRAISKAIQEMDDQTLRTTYILVIHIQ